jgi:isopropylmalate/homocitrate/citramalate synthase
VSVTLCEVGPRDGLQNEPCVLDPGERAELVARLVACGLRRVEVTSFVNPVRVPAMADAEAVAVRVSRLPGVTYAGLVLNERGYERLWETTALDEVRMVVACTESFSARNAGATIEAAAQAAVRIARRGQADGLRVSITLAVAFGCPFEGRTPVARVLDLAERLAAEEPDELILADTIGVAAPREVRRLVSAVAALGRPVGVHLHDTRNTAVAGVYEALESGAEVIDTAVGGSGGCPFAPGAAGNVATEDVVYALERDGIETGVELDAVVEVARWLSERLGHPLDGHLHRVAATSTRSWS